MSNDRDQAIHLLQHYMRSAWECAGLRWDGDNYAEMEILVDHLLDAAAAKALAAIQPVAAATHYHDATGHEDRPCACPTPGTHAQGPSETSPLEIRISLAFTDWPSGSETFEVGRADWESWDETARDNWVADRYAELVARQISYTYDVIEPGA